LIWFSHLFAFWRCKRRLRRTKPSSGKKCRKKQAPYYLLSVKLNK